MAGSKVTTKKGDKGSTRTISGEHHTKSHPILECCGTLDEVRAELALLRIDMVELEHDEAGEIASMLYWILHVFFLMGTECNDPTVKKPEYRYQRIGRSHLSRLEDYQGYLEDLAEIPPEFICSARTPIPARFDLLCTRVRRLERRIVSLKEAVPEFDETFILPFINRLSDFLFIAARVLDDNRSLPVDYAALD